MRVHERVERRAEQGPVDDRVQVDPEPPARDRRAAGRRGRRFLERREMRDDLLVEAPPFLGQRHRARRAVEKPDSQPLFEPRERAAHARRRHADQVGRRRERAGVGDRGEHADPVRQVFDSRTHRRFSVVDPPMRRLTIRERMARANVWHDPIAGLMPAISVRDAENPLKYG